MDIYLKRRERENNYFYAFGQLAARDLTRVADIVSGRHIKDYFLKAKFKHEIKLFNEGNLQAISKAKNDNECKEAINNIKEECFHLTRQGDMLSMRKAKIFLTVNMEKYNKEIGYTINAINLAIGAGQAVAGVNMLGMAFRSASLIGKIAGAHVILSGSSSVIENYQKLRGYDNPQDYLKNAYTTSAEFMGFDEKYGLTAYYTADIMTSVYGVFRLTLKPDARRLYRYIPSDYQMHIKRMSKASLTLKVISTGNKLRIISGIHSDNDEN